MSFQPLIGDLVVLVVAILACLLRRVLNRLKKEYQSNGKSNITGFRRQ